MQNSWTKNLPGVALTLAVLVALIPVNSAFAMRPVTGAVHSTVTVAGTTDPLAGVTIKVLDMNTAETVAEAQTTQKGIAEIAELPLGLYQVTVVAPEGYASTAGPLVFFDPENTAANLNFALEPLPSAPAGGVLGGGALGAIIGLAAIAGVVTAVAIAVTRDDTP